MGLLLTFAAALLVLTLSACSTEQLQEETKAAVDTYNSAVDAYNSTASDYNEAVTETVKANEDLQSAINAAQDAVNKGEDPFDPATLEDLNAELTSAANAKVVDPEALPAFEKLTVSDGMKRKELNDLMSQADTGTEEIAAIEIPNAPEVPNYTETIQALSDKQKAYEDSVQGLKQITAPKDDFVMERLQRIDTITAMAAVTEDHDPNGLLNKQGGYIGCVYFTASQVDRSELYLENGDDVIEVGTDGGGAVEVFNTAEEAEARNGYLGSFDGSGMLASGSHYVKGTCLIRTSNYLTASQQEELTQKITDALVAVE